VIRVFGTIGWIVANLVVSGWLKADLDAIPLQIAGGGAIALGLYSFFLPHTPPPAAGKKASVREVLGLDALKLMKSRSFSVFIVSSMLICIPLAAYYAFAQLLVNHAGFARPAATMSIGQMSEIVFMLLMPLFFVRFGVKWMLLVGMLAWAGRYVLFSAAAPTGIAWMILAGIVLHGICYDFFFVTGFIYTDKKATKEIRGQAQGFLVLVTQGIGLGIGAQVMQRIVTALKSDQYDTITAEAEALRNQHAELLEQASAAADAGNAALAEQLREQAMVAWQGASDLLLQSYDWQTIWIIPAIMAGVILVAFFVLFKDDGRTASTDIDHATEVA
jgi:nucleoside transporter